MESNALALGFFWSPTLQLWNNFIRYAPKKILCSTQSVEEDISKQNLGTSQKFFSKMT
ncbi:MAG: hypothetical protein KAI83_07275 [Thiomargarita sp.]|nr:hypothetical protein [Thiomargarita sp.]